MRNVPLWVYIAVMALVTYAIRALPFVLVRSRIRSRFVRSFLQYMPYAVLSAMTLPAVFSSTGSAYSAAAGCAAAVILALKGKSLIVTALAACACAYLVDALITVL